MKGIFFFSFYLKGILTLVNSRSRFISLGIAQLVRWLALFPFVLNTSSNPYFLFMRVVLIYLRRLFLSLLLLGCFGWQKNPCTFESIINGLAFQRTTFRGKFIHFDDARGLQNTICATCSKRGQVFD